MKKKALIIFLLSLICCTALSDTHQKLNSISKKIATLKSKLTDTQSKRAATLAQLRHSDVTYSHLAIALHQTHQNISDEHNKLKKLTQNKTQLQQKITEQQTLLVKQIRTAYMLGRQPYLKLLLSHQDANKIGRMLTYYQYISQARLNTIHDIAQLIQQVDSNQQAITQQLNVLTNLQQQQQHNRIKLRHANLARRQLIKRYNQQIRSKSNELKTLVSNKRQMELTLRHLEQYAIGGHYPFNHLRGKMPWPTLGRIENYFGQPIHHSQIRWGGLLIKAPEGRPVYAIANGKVVFSQWMSGYGMLIIISHGRGYMTIYGRNQSLYRKVGDIVHAGDLIATVGHSGGYQQPALYFAIRHNARPLNPSRWCRANIHHRTRSKV